MSNEIRAQFVRDMQVAGLSAGTQGQYLSSVDLFFKATWLSPEAATEQDVQTFLIGLRERDVARETFRGYRFALESLFANTLGRDWAPLPSALLEDLRRVWVTHRHPVWLFANKRGSNHVDTGALYKLFAQVRGEQGLGDAVKPHALRHSFATRLIEQGVPAETVRILLGHASIKTTQTYLHLTEPIRRQVTQAVSGFCVSLFD